MENKASTISIKIKCWYSKKKKLNPHKGVNISQLVLSFDKLTICKIDFNITSKVKAFVQTTLFIGCI